MRQDGRIRIGVGGWSFAPWRDNFYPQGLAHAQELAFASRKVSAIEINATFYRTQSQASFRRWADETPDDFVFSIKAHRLTTHRKRLAESGPSIEHFLGSGVIELGRSSVRFFGNSRRQKNTSLRISRLSSAGLPQQASGYELRNVLEVRHGSFCNAGFVALARRYACAICLADSDKYPLIADVTANFIYARLHKSAAAFETGYAPTEIGTWAERAKLWARGRSLRICPISQERLRNGSRAATALFFLLRAQNSAMPRRLARSSSDSSKINASGQFDTHRHMMGRLVLGPVSLSIVTLTSRSAACGESSEMMMRMPLLRCQLRLDGPRTYEPGHVGRCAQASVRPGREDETAPWFRAGTARRLPGSGMIAVARACDHVIVAGETRVLQTTRDFRVGDRRSIQRACRSICPFAAVAVGR